MNLGEIPSSAMELTLFDFEDFNIIREDTIARWRAANSSAIYEISQRTIGGDLVQFGIPRGASFEAAVNIVTASDAAQAVFDQFRTMIGPQARKLAVNAIREIVDEALGAIGYAIDTIEWVPAWGWLVEAVWDVAMGIRNLVQLVKAQNRDPKILLDRETYSPKDDVQTASGLNVSILDGVDLNRVFRPPSLGAPHPGASRFRMHDLKPRGSGWVRIEGNNTFNGGIGFCPWTTTIHNKIELAPYGRSVEDTGRFLVATRGTANILRGLTSGTAPILFSVDAERMRKEWTQYLFDFRVFLLEIDISDEAKRKIVYWLGQNPTGPQFDWFGYDSEFDTSKYDENFGIKNSAPVRFWRSVEEHQRAVLNTPAVAYLSDDMPAVSDGPLHDVWKSNRDRLLRDPAGCNVDLSNIRDPLYRARLESATEGLGCLAIGGIVGGAPERKGVLVPMGSIPPLPPPRKPGVYSKSNSRDPMTSFAPYAALGAVGILAWYALNKAKL